MGPIISFRTRWAGVRGLMVVEAPYRTGTPLPTPPSEVVSPSMSDVVSTDCVFCRIAAREIPAEILHETDTAVAFRDLKPKAPTHILLISKEHLDSIADVQDRHGGMLADLAQAAAHLARTEGLVGGWRLVTNVGPDAGQSVFHLHVHLLGGRPMAWPPG
jgi:histidine triad (HIT) family protein